MFKETNRSELGKKQSPGEGGSGWDLNQGFQPDLRPGLARGLSLGTRPAPLAPPTARLHSLPAPAPLPAHPDVPPRLYLERQGRQPTRESTAQPGFSTLWAASPPGTAAAPTNLWKREKAVPDLSVHLKCERKGHSPVLEDLNLGYLNRKAGPRTPNPPDPTGPQPPAAVLGKWPPEGSVHRAGDMAGAALGAELAIGPLSQDRIDDSFLYVTFYPTL